jgi:hypothetical protein
MRQPWPPQLKMSLESSVPRGNTPECLFLKPNSPRHDSMFFAETVILFWTWGIPFPSENRHRADSRPGNLRPALSGNGAPGRKRGVDEPLISPDIKFQVLARIDPYPLNRKNTRYDLNSENDLLRGGLRKTSCFDDMMVWV